MSQFVFPPISGVHPCQDPTHRPVFLPSTADREQRSHSEPILNVGS